jgi:integrase
MPPLIHAPTQALAAAGGSPTRALRLLPGVRPDEHPVLVYLASLGSDNSRVSMRAHLRAAAGVLSGGAHDAFSYPWATLPYGQFVALKAALARTRKRRSVNAAIAGVRRVMRECWLLGQIDAETLERIRNVKALSGSELPTGRALPRDELAALFAACREDPRPIGVRDRAIFAVLYGAGLRVAELTGLDAGHYDPEQGVVRVVAGKGRKDRNVPAHPTCAAHVADWLEERGPAPGPVFVALDPGAARRRARRLTEQAVRDVCARRAAEASVPAFTPHDLRRSFVSDLLAAGVDVVTVQRLAGHASPEVTALYDRRPFGARRDAVARLDLPL